MRNCDMHVHLLCRKYIIKTLIVCECAEADLVHISYFNLMCFAFGAWFTLCISVLGLLCFRFMSLALWSLWVMKHSSVCGMFHSQHACPVSL